MQRNLILRPLLMLVVSGFLAGSGSPTDEKALAQSVNELLTPLVEAKEFTGAIVLARHGEVLYQAGFGMANREAGLEFTPETASDGGSLAKTFTTAALQWLAHEKRVDLDAPVTDYLPEYPHPETTVRHLISHSNGLPPYYEFFDLHFEPGEVRTTEAMLKIIAREVPAPSFVPGSQFEYSNFAFDLAALIIERVSKQSFENFLSERFFSRLDMRSTFARPGRLADWQGVRTLGYRWDGSDWEIVDVFDLEAFLGASNLYFSALDLSRWASANAAGTVLPAAVYEQGQERPLLGGVPSPINGLSWYCSDDLLRCYYSGDINAFHGFVYWDRARDESVTFVSNSSLPFWSMFTLRRQLVAALKGQPVEADKKPDFEPIDDENRASFAGTFTNADQFMVHIAGGEKGLRIRINGSPEFEAFQVNADTLYVPAADMVVAFSGGTPVTAVYLRSQFLDTVVHRSP